MIDILNSILTLIGSILHFAWNGLVAVISILTSIPQYLGVLTSIFSSMPPFIYPFIILSVYALIMLRWVVNK